jgi:hypothetical protein
MIIKVINRIFIRLTKNKLRHIHHKSIKKLKITLFDKRTLKIILAYKQRRRRRRFFALSVRRR